MLEPTLHKPIDLGTRVKIDPEYLKKEASGRVVGIAFRHVIFGYIVLLDVPFQDEYGTHEAISVIGSHLTKE